MMPQPEDLGMVFQAGALGLILLGVLGMVLWHDLMRVILGLTLLESGVNLFIVSVGYRPGSVAPILTGAPAASMVDPLPQALILTAIVIGVGVLALALALAVRVYQEYGVLDLQQLARKLEAPATSGGSGVPVPAAASTGVDSEVAS